MHRTPLTHSIDKQHSKTSITSVPHSPRFPSTPTGRTFSCLLTEKPCSPRKKQPKVIHSPWQCMPSRLIHSCTVLRMKKPSKSGLQMMLEQVGALLGSRHGGIASSILALNMVTTQTLPIPGSFLTRPVPIIPE